MRASVHRIRLRLSGTVVAAGLLLAPAAHADTAGLRPDGSILAVVTIEDAGFVQPIAADVRPDGSLDPAYGENGALRRLRPGARLAVLTDGQARVLSRDTDCPGRSGCDDSIRLDRYDADGRVVDTDTLLGGETADALEVTPAAPGSSRSPARTMSHRVPARCREHAGLPGDDARLAAVVRYAGARARRGHARRGHGRGAPAGRRRRAGRRLRRGRQGRYGIGVAASRCPTPRRRGGRGRDDRAGGDGRRVVRIDAGGQIDEGFAGDGRAEVDAGEGRPDGSGGDRRRRGRDARRRHDPRPGGLRAGAAHVRRRAGLLVRHRRPRDRRFRRARRHVDGPRGAAGRRRGGDRDLAARRRRHGRARARPLRRGRKPRSGVRRRRPGSHPDRRRAAGAGDQQAPEPYAVSGTSITAQASSPEAAAVVECTVGGPTLPCRSPVTFGPLDHGQYSLTITATDADGNQRLDRRRFGVLPDTAAGAGPPAASNSTTAAFTFLSATGSSFSWFECRLDGAEWARCTSPWAVAGLAEGEHTAEVRQVAQVGDPDVAPPGQLRRARPRALPVARRSARPGDERDLGSAGAHGRAHRHRRLRLRRSGCGRGVPARRWRLAGLRVAGDALGLDVGAHALAIRSVDAAGNRERRVRWSGGRSPRPTRRRPRPSDGRRRPRGCRCGGCGRAAPCAPGSGWRSARRSTRWHTCEPSSG